jgi:hypothetical protein
MLIGKPVYIVYYFDFDMGPYEEVISTIKEDLLTVPRHKNKVNTHFRATTARYTVENFRVDTS